MSNYCTQQFLGPAADPTKVQYPNQTFLYEDLDDVLDQKDATVQSAPGFSFADVMKVMGVSDLSKGINKTFQFATPWNRNSSNTDVAKAGILWKTNKHRPSPTTLSAKDLKAAGFDDTFFIGFVSPVKGGGFNNGTFVASDFTWQLTPSGIPILMAATPYTAHVGFLNIFHYAKKYAVTNYSKQNALTENAKDTSVVFGYQNTNFKGTRIVGLDMLIQESVDNAQATGILGQFGMAKTADGNTFLMYTDQGKLQTGHSDSPGQPVFPVTNTGTSYTVSVMHGEPIDTSRVHQSDNSKDESAQLYPTIPPTAGSPGVTNTLKMIKDMPTIVVDPSVKNSYLRWSWSQNIVITEHNLTEFAIGYSLTLSYSPNTPSFTKTYSIPPGGSNVCFQMLMPSTTFTLTNSTTPASGITIDMPLRNYLQAGDYVGRQFQDSSGNCLNVLIRNTKTLGSNVYYYTDPRKLPPMSADETVFGELSVVPPTKLSNAAEIGILVAVVVVLIVVVSVVAWWFTKGKKARDLKLQTAATPKPAL